uniref:Uncharacterized protein n=1 Tax=Ditylenchus dipsaci TaxID=166011 RepID=A0A915DEZ0_9BILA
MERGFLTTDIDGLKPEEYSSRLKALCDQYLVECQKINRTSCEVLLVNILIDLTACYKISEGRTPAR